MSKDSDTEFVVSKLNKGHGIDIYTKYDLALLRYMQRYG
jgi:hypothetical protein